MPNNMSWCCGAAVHNAGASIGLVPRPIHRPACKFARAVDNNYHKPVSFTHAYWFLYATYEQYYTTLSSVGLVFVHIFHSPYIKSYELNKGVF